MKNFFSLKKAFTMLEMSVVILIIGLLIAAMTVSSSVINKMRLQTAKSLTLSSPVNSTPDLILWFEPTMAESFNTSEAYDGSYISTWLDINPQLTIKNSLVTSTLPYSATYKKYGINNLPTVSFPDFGGYDVFKTANMVLPKGGQFTAFMVFQLLSTASDGGIKGVFYNGNYTSDGFGYIRFGNPNIGQRRVKFGSSANNINSTLSSTLNPEIATITCCNSTVTLSVNGTALTITSPASSYVTPSDYLYIGGDNTNFFFYGYISEFIMFERVLTAAEITAITQYLSKKYNIKVY